MSSPGYQRNSPAPVFPSRHPGSRGLSLTCQINAMLSKRASTPFFTPPLHTCAHHFCPRAAQICMRTHGTMLGSSRELNWRELQDIKMISKRFSLWRLIAVCNQKLVRHSSRIPTRTECGKKGGRERCNLMSTRQNGMCQLWKM